MRFPERKIPRLFLFFHHGRICYIPLALSNHFNLDPLILSIYSFLFFHPYFIFTSSFLSSHSSSDVSLGASNIKDLHLFFPLRSALLVPFPYSTRTTCLFPTNTYSPYLHLWWIVLRTFLATVMHHHMNLVSRYECPSVLYVEGMQYLLDRYVR